MKSCYMWTGGEAKVQVTVLEVAGTYWCIPLAAVVLLLASWMMSAVDFKPEMLRTRRLARTWACCWQATRVDLKARTEALSTMERQRVQYEAMAKSKQQVKRPREILRVSGAGRHVCEGAGDRTC